MYRILLIITTVAATLCLLHSTSAKANCQDLYVLKSMVNLRSDPDSASSKVGLLTRNTSLSCLEESNGWTHVFLAGKTNGWVRNDLVSKVVMRVHKTERLIRVTDGDQEILSVPVTPGKRAMENGRYFALPGAGSLNVTWPNRKDLRSALEKGRISYPSYKNAIVAGPENMTAHQVAICPSGSESPTCGAFLKVSDYRRLAALISRGARLEIYDNAFDDQLLNQPDEFSRRIHLGALEQLKQPAAGLRPGGRLPALSYPGGDIQPDFASSTDIVIRAVRYAGADLQALIHEDILLHPERYRELETESPLAASHRLVPILWTYLKHNALSLPTDAADHPFCFEAGDILIFSAEGLPDLAGIVSETFNKAGLPLVITIRGMGQSTRKANLLGRKDLKVIGHFRMTHLFDYQ